MCARRADSAVGFVEGALEGALVAIVAQERGLLLFVAVVRRLRVVGLLCLPQVSYVACAPATELSSSADWHSHSHPPDILRRPDRPCRARDPATAITGARNDRPTTRAGRVSPFSRCGEWRSGQRQLHTRARVLQDERMRGGQRCGEREGKGRVDVQVGWIGLLQQSQAGAPVTFDGTRTLNVAAANDVARLARVSALPPGRFRFRSTLGGGFAEAKTVKCDVMVEAENYSGMK